MTFLGYSFLGGDFDRPLPGGGSPSQRLVLITRYIPVHQLTAREDHSVAGALEDVGTVVLPKDLWF